MTTEPECESKEWNKRQHWSTLLLFVMPNILDRSHWEPMALEHKSMVYKITQRSLSQQAMRVLAQLVVRRLREHSAHPLPPENLWDIPKWIDFKHWLQLSLPRGLLEALYRKFFREMDHIDDGPQYFRETVLFQMYNPIWSQINDLPSPYTFILWWAFVDPSESRLLALKDNLIPSPAYHDQLLIFLATNRVEWEEIALRFPWILAKQFRASMKNMPQLKRLRIKGNCRSTIIKILNRHCSLVRLELDSFALRSSLSEDLFVDFLRSQSQLQVLDLVSFFHVVDIIHEASVIQALEEAKSIEKMVFTRSIIDKLVANEVRLRLPQVLILHLHDIDDYEGDVGHTQISEWTQRTFPNLEQFIWDDALEFMPEMHPGYAPVLVEAQLYLLDHPNFLLHLLSQCPNLAKVGLTLGNESEDFMAPIPDVDLNAIPVHKSLAEVLVSADGCDFHFQDLIYLLTKCPRLIYLEVRGRDIKGYEESRLLRILNGPSPSPMNSLSVLKILIFKVMEKQMSNKVVMAFCRSAPMIKYFDRLTQFHYEDLPSNLRELQHWADRNEMVLSVTNQ